MTEARALIRALSRATGRRAETCEAWLDEPGRMAADIRRRQALIRARAHDLQKQLTREERDHE